MFNVVPGRRRFLQKLAGMVAAAFMMPGCGAQRAVLDKDNLSALLDSLIPPDNDPGALQAGLLDVTIARIDGDPRTSDQYRHLLEWLNEQACSQAEVSFHRLPLARRTGILQELYESSDSERALPRTALTLARKHCMQAFYTSPAAESVIGYKPPVEGGYPDYAAPPDARA